jgi:hypothetical protein
MAFYNTIRNKYPNMNIVSTINLNPSGASGSGGVIDLHIYENEAHFVSLLNTFDQASRKYTVFVGEYASIRTGSNTNRQVGANPLAWHAQKLSSSSAASATWMLFLDLPTVPSSSSTTRSLEL